MISSDSHRLNVFEGTVGDFPGPLIEGMHTALRVNEEPGVADTFLVRQVLTEGRLALKSNLISFLGENLLQLSLRRASLVEREDYTIQGTELFRFPGILLR